MVKKLLDEGSVRVFFFEHFEVQCVAMGLAIMPKFCALMFTVRVISVYLRTFFQVENLLD